MSDLGIVIIGRNEGPRLRMCIQSALLHEAAVIYVDSGSLDGSAKLAAAAGVRVVELDNDRPFSAARARNAGWQHLAALCPDVKLVQFVDGDCELREGWIEQGRRELEQQSEVAVVCGRRRERYPDTSVFNRLCDVEWNVPIGDTLSCGGDSMMRLEALHDLGGFDETVVAGEEPELCGRLRKQGWKILRIDAEMTWHDAAITRWSQWWRRQIRSGHGALDIAVRLGVDEFTSQVRSVRLWTLGWCGITLLTALAGSILVGGWGFVAAMGVGFLIVFVQMYRVATRIGKRESLKIGWAYSLLNFAGKWAQLWGQLRWQWERIRGRQSRLIEYKSCTTSMGQA